MIFQHRDLENHLKWTDDTHLCELIVENPRFLRQVLHDLSVADSNNGVSFTEKGKLFTVGKEIDVIFNPIQLDFNSRRAVMALLKTIVSASLSEDFYLKTNELKTELVGYLDKLVKHENFGFEVITDDFKMDDLVKVTNLHIAGNEEDFVELLTAYMAMMAELINVRLTVFVNLRSLITDDELLRFCHNLSNHQLDTLLIEGIDYGRIEQSSRIVVDRDNCEI